jgi:protein-S-isoprenylcysteine O-methyltransferase Ste14
MAVQFDRMLKEMDIPPLWLALALAFSWGLGGIWSVAGLGLAGMALIGAGLGLMGVAVATMVLARTTFVPRRAPAVLVTGGVFGFSRNPIYLGDALILTGAILYWGALLALPLVPAFMVLITRRYILDEEARLRARFGPEFAAWATRVPRWIGRI